MIADKVRSAKNPQEAMLAIAEGIDALMSHPRADGWDVAWEEPEAHDDETRTYQTLEEIEDIRQKLASGDVDPEDRMALEARLRLLEDDGKPQGDKDERAEGERVVMVDKSGKVDVNLPPPTEAQVDIRRRLVDLMKEAEPDKWTDEFCDAYLKGGPLWLYYGDPQYVKEAVPMSARKAMVLDVETHSPAEAAEMARDILKVWDVEEQTEFEMNMKG